MIQSYIVVPLFNFYYFLDKNISFCKYFVALHRFIIKLSCLYYSFILKFVFSSADLTLEWVRWPVAQHTVPAGAGDQMVGLKAPIRW